MYCIGTKPAEIDWSEPDEKKRQHRREIVRKSQRKRRAKARKTGMCSQCCKGKPAKGRKTCPACLEKAREKMRHVRKSTI